MNIFYSMSAKLHKIVEFSATEKLLYGVRNDSFLTFSWQGCGFKCRLEKIICNALLCKLKILSYTLPSPKVATSDGLFANQSNGAKEPA
jgi:hypothetical protein